MKIEHPSRWDPMKLGLLPLLTFLLSLLSGCISVPTNALTAPQVLHLPPAIRPELPESIGNDGLVVADVQGLGRLTYFGNAEVIIKGGKRAKLYGHYLVQPLPPGQYAIEALRQTSGPGTTFQQSGVTVMVTNFGTAPIKIDFTVRAGEVTNLGQLLLIPDENDARKKDFVIGAVDNSADMDYFLRTTYPKLHASLREKTLAPGKYMQAQDLQRLRRHIALNLGESMASRARYVAGPAGTLALLDRDPEGSVTNVRLLDSPVRAGLQMQAEQPDRFGFITDDGRFFLVIGDQVEARSLPIAHPTRLFLFRDRGVIVVDNKFNLYTSNDNGHNWQQYAGAVVDDSVESWLTGGVAEDRDGYYVYRSLPPRLMHATYGSAEYQPVATPKGAISISGVTERRTGLFLETNITAWLTSTPHPFFFRPVGSHEWETRYKPQAMCKNLEFLDDTGQRVRARCSGEVYDSSDGGVSWRR